jgi:hypothetical protein
MVAQKAPAPPAGAGGNAEKAGAGEAASRKIIYNADLRLIVKDLEQSVQELKQLLKDHDAFIGSSETGSSSGAPREAIWRVRVPAERFDWFVDGVTRLGVAEKNRTDSQDVTEEYYDLVDRIKNKKMEQETLRGYLQDKKATSKLEDILTIEKELSRVRGELDAMEGRLRRLKDLAALATVTITMREIKDYVPPTSPTYGDTLRGTFADSINLLVRFGRTLLLVLVALLPWLVVLAVIGVPLWMVARRHWPSVAPGARVQAQAPGPEQGTPPAQT